ncbi:MAG: LPS assembly lipoprotein LptE [Gammaproteobacteria bacterium]
MSRLIPLLNIMLCLLLAGCGFQLRQPAQLPDSMQRTYIADSGGNSELVRALSRSLDTPKTHVIDNATTATATLNILNSQKLQRVLSVSNTGQPLEYQVAYQVQFSLITAGGKTLVAPQKLTLTRNYNYSTTNTIGDTEQSDLLYKALEDNMAELIMFRIDAASRDASRKH